MELTNGITAKLVMLGDRWERSHFKDYYIDAVLEDFYQPEKKYALYFNSKHQLANKESMKINFNGFVSEAQGIKVGDVFEDLSLLKNPNTGKVITSKSVNEYLRGLPLINPFSKFKKIVIS
jgi:deoxyadenosine/deoxycytidine kinase